MRLYEWEAKQLLAERGIAVPGGALASWPADAERLASGFETSVIKAQVLHGGRMKAGLVQFADAPERAAAAATSLLGRGEFESVLIEPRLPAEQERFVGALYDPRRRAPVLVYTPAGGIDVETDSRGSLAQVELDARGGVREFQIRGALRRAGVTGRDVRALTRIAATVAQMLLELDATLVEVNPLADIPGQGWVALDAHIELDDDALVRHSELVERFRLEGRGEGGKAPTDTEMAARAIDALDHRGVAGRLVEFDGDIALIIGGGGASLTVFDAIRDAGGRPANYCEVGGNPSVGKVAAFTTLLLERLRPDRIAVIMNVVSNTRADLVARGVIQGCLDAGRSPANTVAVFRVPGAWEDDSRDLLADYGIEAFGREIGIDASAQLAVARGRAA